KYFAMTGWRLGYVCAPKEIIRVITKIHQYSVMCAPTVAQYTALEALNASFKSGFKEVNEMLDIYDERRKYILDRLDKMGLDCFTPRGAFYVFPSVKSTGLSGEQFAYALLDFKNVAVIPGNAFGSSGNDFIRISYAYSLDVIKNAFDLIEEFVNEIKI
ncbi:MAG: aminotransferase class I/II-fold pyridoxal phosphate-dependent enzyme, partial [Clostridia bacterium]|nr:aminotransferase class I/II-fold pyridoxal phosphate-dependent enzyme [Clostridia bacterium]